jgi:high-affinity iron transporter
VIFLTIYIKPTQYILQSRRWLVVESRGSLFSLAFAAFFAFFREGAELILFYWALLIDTQTYVSMAWAGLGADCVVLVVVYILMRFMSVRLPLKPFFMGTSVVLSLMAVSFIGTRVKNLQTANVVGVSPVSGIPLGLFTLKTAQR